MNKANTLETREQRAKLRARHEPYWRSIGRGLAIGYRKGANGGEWYVRRYLGGQYVKDTLGQRTTPQVRTVHVCCHGRRYSKKR